MVKNLLPLLVVVWNEQILSNASPALAFFICVPNSRKVLNVVTPLITSRHRPPSLIGHTHLSPSNHRRHSLWGLVGSSANPDVEDLFPRLFLLTLTLPLHEVMVSCFVFPHLLFCITNGPCSSSPFYPTYLPLFLFFFFVLTASRNRSG